MRFLLTSGGMGVLELAALPTVRREHWESAVLVSPGSEMALGADRTLGLVDLALFPHLDRPGWPDAAMDRVEQWVSGIPVPTDAIDDATALRVWSTALSPS